MLRLAKYGLTLPISQTTAYSWMIKLNYKVGRAQQSYYTDGHERAVVVEHRGGYTRRKRRLAQQLHWIRIEWDQLSQNEKTAFEPGLEENTDECPAKTFMFEQGGKKWLEFHVDFLGGASNEKHDALREQLGPEGGSCSVRFEDAASAPCEYSHAPEVSRCSEQLYHIGQDEGVYRAYAREGKEWVIRGVCGLRRKTEGAVEMVSTFQDELRGFGLPYSEPELADVNELRCERGRPALKATAGSRFLRHSKNKEGQRGYDQFE